MQQNRSWSAIQYSTPALDLPTLAYCRHRADMIMTYNLLQHNLGIDPTKLFQLKTASLIRGHNHKTLQAPKTVQDHFFTIRIINHWNNLPWATVNSPSVNAFKKIIDNYNYYPLLLDNDI